MPTQRSLLASVSLFILLTLGGGGAAQATINNQKSFKAAYPGKDAKIYSCKVCHQGAIGKKGDLNAYGVALQTLKAAEGAKKLTEEDYRAIEGDDADEDGATNLQEWEAGTDVSDAQSVPAGAAKPEIEEDDQEHEGHHHDEGSALPEDHQHHVRAFLDRLLTPEAWAAKSESTEASQAGETAREPEYVGTETCAACHPAQQKSFQRGTHAAVMIEAEGAVEGCESCHGPGRAHSDAGGDKTKIIRYSAEQCFACHLDKRAQFQLQYHHPVPEGRMACTDCHALHGLEARAVVPTALSRGDEVCFQCHKELKGPFVFEHDAMREGCSVCHEPHGAPFDKLLVASEASLCLRCHWEVGVNSSNAQIGGVPHSGYTVGRGENCVDHHRAPHGSNIWRTFNR